MGLFFKTKKDSFERFWIWFKQNEDRIYNFEKDQEKIFDELAHKLALIDTNLTFEFSNIKDNGKREFIISADGIKSSFISVEGLAKKAPSLEKWTIIKYRPRRITLNELKFKNKSVKPEDVYFAIFNDDDPNKVGIILFFRDYEEQEKDTWGQIGYLILDEALGEYDVETKVGGIVFESINSEYFKHSHPLIELQQDFDRYFPQN
jgi:hypothetical protein